MCANAAPAASSEAPAPAPAPSTTALPCPPSAIGEIVSWRRAEVVTARFTNGIVAHYRRMPDAGLTAVAATLTPGFDDEATGAGAAQAAESTLTADPRASGLRVNVMSAEHGLMAVIRGPDDRTPDMLALVARLANESFTFDPVRDAGPRAGSARAHIRRAMNDVLDGRPPDLCEDDRPPPPARWPDAPAPGSVEVAIVGGITFADALAAADAALGGLAPRPAPAPAQTGVPRPDVPRAAHRITIACDDANLPEGREAVAVGVLVRNGDTLAGQRLIALASTLLRLRLAQSVAAQSATAQSAAPDVKPNFKPSVQFAPRGVRPGAALITITATSPSGEGERAAARFDEAFRALARDPAPHDEFETARTTYIDVARELMADATYWAGVLAACSTRGYTPDDLAAVEADLRAITPDAVASVLTRALAQGPPMTIVVRPAAKAGQP